MVQGRRSSRTIFMTALIGQTINHSRGLLSAWRYLRRLPKRLRARLSRNVAAAFGDGVTRRFIQNCTLPSEQFRTAHDLFGKARRSAMRPVPGVWHQTP
jgi:hypothetical protein